MRDTLLSSVAAIALAFGVTAAAAQNTADPRRGDDQSQRTLTDQTQRDQSTQSNGQSQNMPSGQRGAQSNQQGGQNQQGARAPQQSGSASGGTQGQSQQGAHEPASAQDRQGAASEQGQSQQGAQAPRQGTGESQAATRETKQPDASGRIELGEQQQTRVNNAIRQQKIEPVTNLNFAVSVGTAVPSSVRLSPLPTELADVLPRYRSYSFFVAQREVVIVDPQSYRIVAFVPLAGGTVGTAATTESGAPPPSPPKMRTKRTERRRLTDHERQKDADRHGADRETDVTEGSSRSESEIEEVPPRARRMVPPVRRYRYFEPDDRGPVVVEPSPRPVFPLFDIFR